MTNKDLLKEIFFLCFFRLYKMFALLLDSWNFYFLLPMFAIKNKKQQSKQTTSVTELTRDKQV